MNDAFLLPILKRLEEIMMEAGIIPKTYDRGRVEAEMALMNIEPECNPSQ